LAWEVATAWNALTTACFGIPPLLVGSGKVGTPCERIQEANATSPVACVLPLAAGLAVVVVVEEATFATPGELPPPQPAASTAKAAAAMTEARMIGRRCTLFVSFQLGARGSSPPQPERVGAEAERLLRASLERVR
jgi:hypothetical protein